MGQFLRFLVQKINRVSSVYRCSLQVLMIEEMCKEDPILINYLCKFKCYGAERLMKEFPVL